MPHRKTSALKHSSFGTHVGNLGLSLACNLSPLSLNISCHKNGGKEKKPLLIIVDTVRQWVPNFMSALTKDIYLNYLLLIFK